MGFAVFKYRPTSEEVAAALMPIMFNERIRPEHLIVDHLRNRPRPPHSAYHSGPVWLIN